MSYKDKDFLVKFLVLFAAFPDFFVHKSNFDIKFIYVYPHVLSGPCL